MHYKQSTSKRLTHNTLLRGRITLQQFHKGNRNSLEPILLAASIPIKPHQTILEIGCGNGAGLLCLIARQPHIHIYGIEKDPHTADLCRTNLQNNHINELNTIYTGSFPQALPSKHIFDHCMANPPWHDHQSSRSPHKQRELARTSTPTLLEEWIKGAKKILKHKGIFTLILPTSTIDRAIIALSAHRFGEITLHPFWPKEGREARIVIIQSRLNMKGGMHITPGTILHEQDGHYTKEATALLEKGEALTPLSP